VFDIWWSITTISFHIKKSILSEYIFHNWLADAVSKHIIKSGLNFFSFKFSSKILFIHRKERLSEGETSLVALTFFHSFSKM
jgi:hypothetical protein